jgi:cytochrome c5
MRSKNSRPLTVREAAHVELVKQLPCSVCDAPGPSDAHHIEQGLQYIVVALCKDCHQGPVMGWHGQKRAWAVRKMNELDALNVTIRRMYER